MPLPIRRTARLRFGRVSEPGARYFVTCCTKDRTPVFASSMQHDRCLGVLRDLHASADIQLRAASVMPDHIHLLFELGARLSLGQTLAKLKNLAREKGRAAWHWQDDGFEHRLRSDEAAESYSLYIFMNPYCAGLCSLDQRWPGWICPNPDQFQFLAQLGELSVPVEWLSESDRISKTITAGE